MRKSIVLIFTLLGAFIFPFGLIDQASAQQPDANGNINCVRCNGCKNCRNCQDMTNCTNCIDCHDCTGCVNCTDCGNCTNGLDCTGCHHCTGCEHCTNLNNCTVCKSCKNCTRCTSCTNCTNCSDKTSQNNLNCGGGEADKVDGHLCVPAKINKIDSNGPYQVSLQRSYAGKKSEHFCGGVIIRSNWILTAAHCFDSDKSLDFIIRYGTIYADKNGAIATPDRLIIHSNYHQDALIPNNDIALIRTPEFIKMNTQGSLAYAIQVATSEVVTEGGKVNVSGWLITKATTTDQPEPVRQLGEIPMSVRTLETCLPKGLSSTGLVDNLFCAGVTVGGCRNTDSTYSGGPAVQNGKLVGVESGQSDHPGLYMGVAKYSSWIDEQIDIVEQEIKGKLL